jgi:hypothetical protein
MKILHPLPLIFLLFKVSVLSAQYPDIKGIPSEVDFAKHLREWDGFGFNYVETAHTYDYDVYPQEYGGFSLLDENEKEGIINLVFGEDGLKISLLKMFLDPLHQDEPGGKFNHELSTKNMLEFAVRGLAKTRERDDGRGTVKAKDFLITTCTGPRSRLMISLNSCLPCLTSPD